MLLPTANMQHSLTPLGIIISISCKLAGNKDAISLGVKQNISGDTPCAEILKQIKDMATDNRGAIEGLIGRELTKRILNL